MRTWPHSPNFLMRAEPPPRLCLERELVEFSAGFSPGWVVLFEDRNETVAVGRFDQVGHLVNDDVFKHVLRLFHQFGVEADVARLVIAAPPLGLHSLEEVTAHLDPEVAQVGLTPEQAKNKVLNCSPSPRNSSMSIVPFSMVKRKDSSGFTSAGARPASLVQRWLEPTPGN